MDQQSIGPSLQDHVFVRDSLLAMRPRVELFTGTTKILDSITLC
jgi:hypothetical protein